MPNKPSGWGAGGGCGPLLAAAVAAALAPGLAAAHGFAGKRFFPSTLTFNDPFTQDEVNVLYRRLDNVNEGGTSTDEQGVQVNYAKSITPSIQLSIGTAYDKFKFTGATPVDGTNNLAVGIKGIGYVDPQAESVWSLGLDVSVARTGSDQIGRDYSIFSPTVMYGKGFGGASAGLLRPLQIAAAVGMDLPARGSVSRAFNLDLALEYNLSYMTSFVQGTALPWPFRDAVPVIEMPLAVCVDQGCRGDLTGTVNPGIMFYNPYGQIALEAPVPINGATGNSVGVLLQVDLYLDRLFPHSLGRPIFN